VLELGPDRRVAADDARERLPLDEAHDARVHELVPEAVAVAQRGELLAQDALRRGADQRARDVVLGQDPDPRVDLVDVRVDRREARERVGIGGDVGERRRPAEADVAAQVDVAREAVVAAALQVERGEVEAIRCTLSAPLSMKNRVRSCAPWSISTSPAARSVGCR
jgi:hypothetical protein